MSPCTKKFIALAVCWGVAVSSVGLIARFFAPIVPPVPKAVAHNESSAVKLALVQEPANGFVVASYDEPTRDVLSAEESVDSRCRNVVVRGVCLSAIITPKVSRYLAKSVLIL